MRRQGTKMFRFSKEWGLVAKGMSKAVLRDVVNHPSFQFDGPGSKICRPMDTGDGFVDFFRAPSNTSKVPMETVRVKTFTPDGASYRLLDMTGEELRNPGRQVSVMCKPYLWVDLKTGPSSPRKGSQSPQKKAKLENAPSSYSTFDWFVEQVILSNSHRAKMLYDGVPIGGTMASFIKPTGVGAKLEEGAEPIEAGPAYEDEHDDDNEEPPAHLQG